MRVPTSIYEFKEFMSENLPHIPATWDLALWSEWVDCRTNDPAEFERFVEVIGRVNRRS